MSRRNLIILIVILLAIVVGGVWVVYYYLPQRKLDDRRARLPEVYQKYLDANDTAVATNRYTHTGFEREEFNLVSPAKGVVIVFNVDPEREMNLIVKGPGSRDPRTFGPVEKDGSVEIPLDKEGEYTIADAQNPDLVNFTATMSVEN